MRILLVASLLVGVFAVVRARPSGQTSKSGNGQQNAGGHATSYISFTTSHGSVEHVMQPVHVSHYVQNDEQYVPHQQEHYVAPAELVPQIQYWGIKEQTPVAAAAQKQTSEESNGYGQYQHQYAAPVQAAIQAPVVQQIQYYGIKQQTVPATQNEQYYVPQQHYQKQLFYPAAAPVVQHAQYEAKPESSSFVSNEAENNNEDESYKLDDAELANYENEGEGIGNKSVEEELGKYEFDSEGVNGQEGQTGERFQRGVQGGIEGGVEEGIEGGVEGGIESGVGGGFEEGFGTEFGGFGEEFEKSFSEIFGKGFGGFGDELEGGLGEEIEAESEGGNGGSSQGGQISGQSGQGGQGGQGGQVSQVGGQSGFRKQGGQRSHLAKHSAHGGKGDKGSKYQKEYKKGGKGELAKKQDNGYYKKNGANKAGHFDKANQYNEHHNKQQAVKGEKIGAAKQHKKGQKTGGFHNVYKKDEYKKNKTFYDESDDNGHYSKHGSSKISHGAANTAQKKGGKSVSDYHGDNFGKKGAHEKKHFVDGERGFKGQHGHQGHHVAKSDFVKEEGKKGGEKYLYSGRQGIQGGQQGKYY